MNDESEANARTNAFREWAAESRSALYLLIAVSDASAVGTMYYWFAGRYILTVAFFALGIMALSGHVWRDSMRKVVVLSEGDTDE